MGGTAERERMVWERGRGSGRPPVEGPVEEAEAGRQCRGAARRRRPELLGRSAGGNIAYFFLWKIRYAKNFLAFVFF